jgi:glutamyl-tRNA synthetase
MAPSPTGEFHIGGMRTLLYNFAFAKKDKGEFIIRIEDTDRERLVEGATERLLTVIKKYGFYWDEGPEVGGPFAPYVQSERLAVYQKYVKELIDSGKAYYCFCTHDRLAEMREEQKKKGITATKYDRHCLSLSKSEITEKLTEGSYVVRLKVPENTIIQWKDGVLGEVKFNSNEIDDQVLMKSDGYPTYHLGVVVDDYLMNITHVMRGNEWLPSTPKHILLYQAFGWEIPEFLHLPNLKELGSTKKLSKRHGPVSAQGFLDEGYLPEALVNYLMFLGWNPGTEKEIYSLNEFVKDFDLKKIHKTDLVSFDRKKLEWMNSQYIMKLTNEEFAKKALAFAPVGMSKDLLIKIAPFVKDRIKKLSDLKSFVAYFVTLQPPLRLTENFDKHIIKAHEALKNISAEEWSLERINSTLAEVIEENGFKTGDFYMDLRGAIAGSRVTPPINESIEIIGRENTLTKLEKSLHTEI